MTDILSELEKPGRDPRPAFTTASFAEGVETLEDLAPGMVLEGVVTNVAAFGAFVDIGVHQDGLVHVSAMSRNFVSDPREVVKPGDVVRVRVLGVDIPRKRVSLSLRLEEEAPGRDGGNGAAGNGAAAIRGTGARAAGPWPMPCAGRDWPQTSLTSGAVAGGADSGGRRSTLGPMWVKTNENTLSRVMLLIVHSEAAVADVQASAGAARDAAWGGRSRSDAG